MVHSLSDSDIPARIKLQAITRRNGRVEYYVVLPKKLVEALGWGKGDELVIDATVLNVNVKTRREWVGLIIYRERDKEILT